MGFWSKLKELGVCLGASLLSGDVERELPLVLDFLRAVSNAGPHVVAVPAAAPINAEEVPRGKRHVATSKRRIARFLVQLITDVLREENCFAF